MGNALENAKCKKCKIENGAKMEKITLKNLSFPFLARIKNLP